MNKRKALILCTGNSCRSQIAEGLINHFLGDDWEARSAGTDPAGYVHPLAIQVMAESGVDISEGQSEHVDAYRHEDFDVVVTVCDDAAENCPLWLGSGRVVHIGFPDPAKATGSEQERLALFRTVRDDIRQKILHYLTQTESRSEAH